MSHGSPIFNEHVHAPTSTSYDGPFGRMFPNLPPYEPPVEERGAERAAAVRAWFEKEAKRMDEGLPRVSEENRISRRIPSGYTYLGQFIAHDLSFDPTTVHQRASDPQKMHSFRTPRLDLDHVYGCGPDVDRHMYDFKADDERENGSRFLIKRSKRTVDGETWFHEDLPRNANGEAIIPDARNDSHLILAQLHLAVMKFHNAAVTAIAQRDAAIREGELFEEARRRTIWHYQWVVVHDYLEKMIGRELVEELLPTMTRPESRRRFYKWRERPFIPVEFSAGAFRVGHAMVRSSYRLNSERVGQTLFPDLRGRRKLPVESTIAWENFVKLTDVKPQYSSRLSAYMIDSLKELPAELGPGIAGQSIALLDMLRGHKLGLPSGQDVAQRMDVKLQGPAREGSVWYCVLEEARKQHDGDMLGPLGGRIVGEVLIGLLEGDPRSYLEVDKSWIPHSNRGADFGFAEFLRFAGVIVEESELPFHQPVDIPRGSGGRAGSPTRSAPSSAPVHP